MVDHYSWYTQVEWIKNKQLDEVIKALMKKWISAFETPKKFLTNYVREFQNENMKNLMDTWNIEILTSAV